MPFTPVADLPPNPSVRIFFSGQMILQPSADNKTCEVFVSRSATDHHLSIEVRMKRTGEPDIILMRHLGPLAFAVPLPPNPLPVHGFFIQSSRPQGVRRYDSAIPSPFDESLRHAINLKEIHAPGQPLVVDKSSGQPSIFLDDGIFYSAESTPADLHIFLKKDVTVIRELTPFASLIGANLYDPEVTVKWRQNGKLVTLPLKQLGAGASYEIYITNDPLFEEPLPPGTLPHDELKEYYKMLPDVPTSERLGMHFPTLPPLPLLSAKRDERGTTRTPCMSAISDP